MALGGETLSNWLIGLGAIIAAIAIGWGVHFALFTVLHRIAGPGETFLHILLRRVRGPARLALLIIACKVALTVATFPVSFLEVVTYLLTVALIVLIGWIVLRASHIAADLYLRRFNLDSEDNFLARKHYTQVRILRRAAATVIVILTAAAVMMTSESVRQYGVSLLASAGAAGLILGLALQPLLKNLIAGVQIAIAQPIRLEDAVIVEGEYGWVEEISSTYVVIRLWDWRRLVLPLSYFLERPFQNWTRKDAAIIGSVLLRVDFSAPVEAIREKLQELVAASPRWDKRVAGVQVTNADHETIEIRLLMSARNAATAWDLRCEVREKMIAFLRDNHPGALPRRRVEAPVARVAPDDEAAVVADRRP
ncbi:MAG: mechanosensitive ion channel family protein [Bauldia sp.]|nr:mechanosensitive ion channel family protein [Bauldia sp.]MCW5718193.1 mechanosensitive ion channel family protein [Bauldia sp.]